MRSEAKLVHPGHRVPAGDNLAPEVKATRRGQGIAVPAKYVTVSETQPFR